MPSGYGPWQASNTGGGGGPWGLLIVVVAVAFVVTSTAFANVVHDVMYLVLGVCGLIVVGGLGALALILRNHRANVTWHPPDPIRGTLRPDVTVARRAELMGETRPAVQRPAVQRPAVERNRNEVEAVQRMLRGHVVWDDDDDRQAR